jgi:hypothetical protein
LGGTEEHTIISVSIIGAVVIAVVAGFSTMLWAAMKFDQWQQECNEQGALVGARNSAMQKQE